MSHANASRYGSQTNWAKKFLDQDLENFDALIINQPNILIWQSIEIAIFGGININQ